MSDLIERQAVLDLCESKDPEYKIRHFKEDVECLPSVSTEKTDTYRQGYEAGYKASQKEAYITGWHDAITTALKETHNVYTEDGPFRVVQEETLIGVGMAYEQVSTEKTGQWIAQDIHNCHTNFKCSECGYIHNFMHLYGKPTADYTYCPNCGAKMVVDELVDELVDECKREKLEAEERGY